MYYFSKSTNMSFEDAVATTRKVLQRHHFTILAEIDPDNILRGRLAVGSRCHILSASSPQLTHQATKIDDHVGSSMLCNIVIHQHGQDPVEISAADPAETIGTINHVELKGVVGELRSMLQRVIDDIASRPWPRSGSLRDEELA
jgi:uncharacterized protein (DUF302 family)